MDEFFEEEKVLVQKYETLLYENKDIYFDIDEFEAIACHYILAGEFNKAFDVAMHAELCFPESTGPGIIKARVLLDCQQIQKALDLLTELEEREPLLPIINVLKGKAYLADDRPIDALRELNTALHKEDDEAFFELSFSISDMFMEYGEFEAAIPFLTGLFDANVEPDFKAEVYFQAANCYDNLDNFEEAERLYEKSLDEQPFNDYVWLTLGLLLERAERYSEALRAMDFALTINDKLEPALLGKSGLLMQMERPDEALEILTSFICDVPDSDYALCYIGECYEQIGNLEKAMDHYRKTLERNPEIPDAYWRISKILKKQGDCENALLYVEQALSIEPDNADFLFTQGELFLEIGSTAAALESFRAALEICPEDIEIHIMISLILEITNINAAIAEMKKAHANSPNDFRIICRLATLYYRADDMFGCKHYLRLMSKMDAGYMEKFFQVTPEARYDEQLSIGY